MQNDVLATGLMSFIMHEVVYFGRSAPFMLMDCIPFFKKWKIQDVRRSPNITHNTFNNSRTATLSPPKDPKN